MFSGLDYRRSIVMLSSSVADPDLFCRIQILALINDPISTFFGMCKKPKILQESLLFNFLVHEDNF
jgi:hypothetical protein